MRLRPLVPALLASSALLFSGAGARSAPGAGEVAPAGSSEAPAAPAAASGSPEIASAVRALVRDKHLEGAAIGVVVMDAETGVILAQHGEHAALNPASNAKLVTAAAALAILHGSHRYQTTLGGTIKAGAVSGLTLKGHGDPSLKTRDLWAMAQELKARGVRRVEGDISVDQAFYDEQTTPPAFEQQPNEWAYFRAPVSAVALNGNTITMTVRPTSAGSPAIVTFDPPGYVDVTGTVKTADAGADSVGLELAGAGASLKMTAKVSGSIGEDARLVRYTKRAEDPRLMPGFALKAVLEDSGIKTSGEVKLGSGSNKVLVRHESEPLSSLLYALGKHSDNFYAEMIFKSLASEAGSRPGKSQDAAAIVTKWLEKNELSEQGVVVKNGSGLFDANRTTATSMTRLLRWAWQDPAIRSEFVAQLAIGGVDGTLHKRFRDTRAHRSIRAKTGTLDDSIALSGYVLGPSGKHTLAFSILFNKVSGRASAARIAADKLVDRLDDLQWK